MQSLDCSKYRYIYINSLRAVIPHYLSIRPWSRLGSFCYESYMEYYGVSGLGRRLNELLLFCSPIFMKICLHLNLSLIYFTSPSSGLHVDVLNTGSLLRHPKVLLRKQLISIYFHHFLLFVLDFVRGKINK